MKGTSSVRKAMICSGGGARGAWGVGVIRRLLEQGQLGNYGMVCGSSAGALLAPLTALAADAQHRGDDATAFAYVNTLERFYVTAKKEEVMEPRLLDIGPSAVWALATGQKSFFTVKGLWAKVREMLHEERFAALRGCGVQSVACYVSLRTGNIYHTEQQCRRQDYIIATMASTAIPMLFPPIGDGLVDGGVREALPLQYALDHGFDHIDCLVLNPAAITPNWLADDNLIKIAEATVGLLTHDVLEGDIELGRRIPQTVRMIRTPKGFCSVLDFTPEKMERMVQAGYEWACNTDHWQEL